MATRIDRAGARRTGPSRAEDAARTAAARALLRDRRGQILAETAARLLDGHDPDTDVLPMLYRSLAAERIVDASLGFIVTDAGKPMTLGFIKGFPEAVVQRCLTLDFGQAICGTVALSRRAMHVTNIQGSLDPISELVRAAGINAYACEPLIVGNRLLGTLSFASRARLRFDPDDLAFFRAIAKHVALARDRARRARDGETMPA